MKKRVISILLGAIATLTLGVSFSKEAHADWKKDNIGWYYQDNNSYYTGWKLIDNNWYYFYSDGYMATNDKINVLEISIIIKSKRHCKFVSLFTNNIKIYR